jgi:DNA-binding MarR family transcriptional regulator
VSSPFRGATAVQTHGAIFDLIRTSGVVSRTELVDRSGLTGASITRIVRQLLDDGLKDQIILADRASASSVRSTPRRQRSS